MRRIIFLLSVAFITLIPPVPAAAQALDDNRLAAIRANCQSILQVISQLQKRDLVARTNLGRAYEAANRQIMAFTERAENNNLQTTELLAHSQAFDSAVNSFREAYVRYDTSLNGLHQKNCQEEPAEFDALLITTRGRRLETAESVTRAMQALEAYRGAVLNLYQPQGGNR